MSQPSLHHKVSFFSRSRRASNSSWRTIFQCFFPWVHLNYHVHLSQSPPFFMVTGNTNAPSIPCALSAGWSDSKLPRLAVWPSTAGKKALVQEHVCNDDDDGDHHHHQKRCLIAGHCNYYCHILPSSPPLSSCPTAL